MVAPSVLVREGTRKKRHNYGGDALKSSIERLRLKPIKMSSRCHIFLKKETASPLVTKFMSKTKKRECYVLTWAKSNGATCIPVSHFRIERKSFPISEKSRTMKRECYKPRAIGATCIPATSFWTSILMSVWLAKLSQIPDERSRFILQAFSM